MKLARSLSVVLSLALGAGLVAQSTTPAPKKAGKTSKPKKPRKPRKISKPKKPTFVLTDLAAQGGLAIYQAPKFGPGYIRGWQPAKLTPAMAIPALVDLAYQAAFQKLQAAQLELSTANTPKKARLALDKIQKATMQVRRALWKAEKAGRKLQPRPATTIRYGFLGGIRLHAVPLNAKPVLVPTVIH